MPADPRLVLLTRVGCDHCAAARAELGRIAAETGVAWEERDATLDPADWAEYGDRVPVLLLDGREHSYWTIDAARLRRDLTR